MSKKENKKYRITKVISQDNFGKQDKRIIYFIEKKLTFLFIYDIWRKVPVAGFPKKYYWFCTLQGAKDKIEELTEGTTHTKIIL